MRIVSVSIQPPRKPSLAANASVILEADGSTLTVSDLRLIRNKQGVLWVAMPSYSVSAGRAFEYFPCVEPDAAFGRRIAEAVLARFAEWEKEQAGVRS